MGVLTGFRSGLQRSLRLLLSRAVYGFTAKGLGFREGFWVQGCGAASLRSLVTSDRDPHLQTWEPPNLGTSHPS